MVSSLLFLTRDELRLLLDTQLSDPRCAWEMQPDGSYVQRTPVPDGEVAKGSQESFISSYDKRRKRIHKLKRRKPQGMRRRNIHLRVR